MEHKSRIAINKLFFLLPPVGGFLLWLGVSAFIAKEIWVGLGLTLFGLIPIVGCPILMPWGYRFDTEALSICYLFLQNERYLWKNIHSIDVVIESSRQPIFDWLFGQEYAIKGHPEGTKRFYMQGRIHKSRRIRKLIESFWDGTIDTGRSSSKKKKKAAPTKLDTSEVAMMEREAREKTRSMTAFFAAEARQLGLELRTEFVYTNEDFDEQKSRPQEKYSYTALFEISSPGETDENRIVCDGADLLYVRLGKKAYRGVVNKDLEAEISSIGETLQEIREQGFEAYISEP